MRIQAVLLPADSVLCTAGKNYDYTDSYQASLAEVGGTVQSVEVGKAFFASAPEWVDILFRLRNRIVAVFGLKTAGGTENRQEMLEKFSCAPGERLGLFKVYAKTDREVVLGEDDRHLNFRISLFIDRHETAPASLTISTTVEFNNWFGRLYFMPVKYFHKLIVPAMLKGIVRELERNTQKQQLVH